MVLCLRENDERVKSSWVRIKEQTSEDDTVVGVCYRTRGGGTSEWGQPEGASKSQIQPLTGDCSHPHLCWSNSTAEHTQCRRLLQSTDDNFLTVVKRPVKKEVLLDLVLCCVTTKNWLGCECWGQPWLHWPWHGAAQDAATKKRGPE